MRDLLAPYAFRRHHFTATVGPRGGTLDHGPFLCLRDIACAETGVVLADHAWCPLPRADPDHALRIGRRIRFRAKVMPYKRVGGGGVDYHLVQVRGIGLAVAATGPEPC